MLGSISQKRGGHLDLGAVNIHKLRLRIVITLVSVYIRFWLISTWYDLVWVLRSQFFECLRETSYKHASSQHLEAARSEKRKKKKLEKNVVFPAETLGYYRPL